MLLIKNFDQFLDALNLCDTGIYSYEEVIETTPIDPEEIADIAEGIPLSGYSKVLLERKYFKVQLITLGVGDKMSISDTGQHSWMKCIKGAIRISDTDTMVKTDETIKVSRGQGIENIRGKEAMAILVLVA